jgi:hypothetical protein
MKDLKLIDSCVYFKHVIAGLSHAFNTLGVPHAVVQSTVDPDIGSLYVTCTAHHLHEQLPENYIAYNFEQLCTDRVWPPAFFDRLRAAVQVWDYSILNIQVLHANGIRNAIHLPMGYAPCMDTDPCSQPATPESWKARASDWMLLGCVNQTRSDKLSHLVDRYDGDESLRGRYSVTNSCWGEQLGEAYRDNRVGLNLHFYTGRTVLEVHRIIPMVANRMWVVSERSDDAWYDQAYGALVTFLPENISPNAVPQAISTAVRLVSQTLTPCQVCDTLERRRRYLVENCSCLGYVRQCLSSLILS